MRQEKTTLAHFFWLYKVEWIYSCSRAWPQPLIVWYHLPHESWKRNNNEKKKTNTDWWVREFKRTNTSGIHVAGEPWRRASKTYFYINNGSVEMPSSDIHQICNMQSKHGDVIGMPNWNFTIYRCGGIAESKLSSSINLVQTKHYCSSSHTHTYTYTSMDFFVVAFFGICLLSVFYFTAMSHFASRTHAQKAGGARKIQQRILTFISTSKPPESSKILLQRHSSYAYTILYTSIPERDDLTSSFYCSQWI